MTFKPGTELDRLVGEKLGFEVITEKEDVQRRQQTEHERGTIALYGDHYVLRRKGLPSVTWAPSTSWASMQLVVEEMQRRGWDYLASSLMNGNHAMRFDHYTIVHGQEVENSARAEAPTLPHAACLAALKALGALEGQADG